MIIKGGLSYHKSKKLSTSKVKFICTNCGKSFSKWAGKCLNCGEWNTLREQIEKTEKTTKIGFNRMDFNSARDFPYLLQDIPRLRINRIITGSKEFDRVLGGGLVPGSLVLLAGDPGMGKSTLALQVATFVGQKQPVLYVSGEESLNQIRLRSERLKLKPLLLHLFTETNLDAILTQLRKIKPHLIIIDSVQTIFSENFTGAQGSVSQVSNCANVLLQVAKITNIPVILIGHVTKEGSVAGPMILEHVVDTILFLEGEKYHELRLLRVIKNRFGSTLEVGIFKMETKGLKEVSNPSGLFLKERLANQPGSIIYPLIEGNRPLLVEIQALVNKTVLAYPRRAASGVNLNRLQVLIAVLEKCLNLKLFNMDVYVNIIGGFKVKEPAVDLAVCLAIISSIFNKPLPDSLAAVGEVGLLGDLRTVNQLDRRIEEVKRLGFKTCLIGGANLPKFSGITIKNFKSLKELLHFLNF